MNSSYKTLFNINILHSYYEDFNSRDTLVVPTEETQKILRNYKLLFRPTAFGGIVLAQVMDKSGLLKIQITEKDDLKLSFHLQTKSMYFHNRTNLDLESKSVFNPFKARYYFDNKTKNEFVVNGYTANTNPLKHLTKENIKSVSETDKIDFIPKVFSIKFDTAINSFSFKIEDSAGDEIIAPITINAVESFKEYNIQAAKKLPDGYYTISISKGGNTSKHQVFLSNNLFNHAPFGRIDIYTKTLAEYSFLSSNVSPVRIKSGIDYFIWFDNRKVKWTFKYKKNPPTKVKITDATNITKELTKSGKTFTSDEKIPLMDTYQKVEEEGKEQKLPNPDGKILKKIADEYFAEILL